MKKEDLKRFFGETGWDKNPIDEKDLKEPLKEVGRLQTMFSNPVEKYILYKDATGGEVLQKYHKSLSQHGNYTEYCKYFLPL